jgi:hypothetical protein
MSQNLAACDTPIHFWLGLVQFSVADLFNVAFSSVYDVQFYTALIYFITEHQIRVWNFRYVELCWPISIHCIITILCVVYLHFYRFEICIFHHWLGRSIKKLSFQRVPSMRIILQESIQNCFFFLFFSPLAFISLVVPTEAVKLLPCAITNTHTHIEILKSWNIPK